MDSAKYLTALLGILVVLGGLKRVLMPNITVFSFIVMFLVICVVFNGIFLALFGRTEEFGYLWGIVKRKIKNR